MDINFTDKHLSKIFSVKKIEFIQILVKIIIIVQTMQNYISMQAQSPELKP
jgi:hypothetical protein